MKVVYKLMQDKSVNIYPNLREQLFLYDKGKYLNYYKNKGTYCTNIYC